MAFATDTEVGHSQGGTRLTLSISRLEAEQDRWFLWLPVVFALGIAVYFQLTFEPSLIAAGSVTVVAGSIWLVARHGIPATLAANVLLVLALGFAAARIRTEVVSSPLIERQFGPVEVRGFVEVVEPRPRRGQRLTIWPVAIGSLPTDRLPVRIRVRTLDIVQDLKPGQGVRLRATLGPPAGPAFPGDFDFARTAWFQQLGAIGLANGRVAMIADLGPKPVWLLWRARVEAQRQAIGARITAALPGERGAIANALITGERGAITEATNQAYRNSGLFHILSISGLHMVIMAGAVFYSIRLVLAAVPRLALRHSIKKWAAAAAILGALGYLVISGSAFATVRSAIMITIMFLAVLLDRPALALRNVALAALVILVLYPESLFDAGFQMSFAAVVSLVSAYEILREWRALREPDHRRESAVRRGAHFIGDIVLSTLIAGVAVAPFGIYHFHNTQLLAFVANIVAIPVCNLIVMPAALATLVLMPFGGEYPALQVMGLGIDAMTAAARYVATLPGAVVRVPSITTTAFLTMIAGGLWLTLWQTSWRVLGLAPIAVGLALAPLAERPDIFVSRDGRMVAIRGADGRLSSVGDRSPMFDLGRWLEAEADGRAPTEVATGQAFRCDPSGCTVQVRGKRVAVARSPAALREDCLRRDIIIASFPVTRRCAPGADDRSPLLIDRTSTERAGAHVISIAADGSVQVATALDRRGLRPWSSMPRPAGVRLPGGLLGSSALGRWLIDVPAEVDRDDAPIAGSD